MRTRRRRIVGVNITAVKLGVPSAFSDLYYSIMEMGWPGFVGLVSAVFVAINLLFGAVYAALPGAIGTMRPGSLADGFFFSVETLGTVGYGNMAPATHLGHAVAAIEILLGLFFSATITGLIFARFARPRDGFRFAARAVIGEWQGAPALMIRLATTRARPVANVAAQVSWLERVDMDDGRVFRRMVELPLVRATLPQLGLAWTLVHLVEEGSPLLAALAGDQPFRLTVSVSGLDTLLASQALGAHSYERADVLRDHEYADAVSNQDGLFELDLRKLDDVVPRAAPIAGAAGAA